MAPLATGKAQVTEGRDLIIGTLQLRNESLVIYAGEHGLSFDVATNDGIVAENLDASELAARHQALFHIYRTSYAQGAPYLDARVDPPTNSALPSAQSARRLR